MSHPRTPCSLLIPPTTVSPWGQGAGYEKGVALHLPYLPPDGGVCCPVTRLQGGWGVWDDDGAGAWMVHHPVLCVPS